MEPEGRDRDRDKAELLSRAIVRELPEGEEPQFDPDYMTIIIETDKSKAEVEQAISDLAKSKENKVETQEGIEEKPNGKTHIETGRHVLKLDVDYQMPAGSSPPSSETTANYIDGAVTNSHPQGIEGQMRRIYSRLQRKIDTAIQSGTNEVELEAAERDLLRKSFNDCKISAQLSKYFVILEDEIERVCKP